MYSKFWYKYSAYYLHSIVVWVKKEWRKLENIHFGLHILPRILNSTVKSFSEARNICRTCCVPIVLNVKTKQTQQFVYTTSSAGILSLQFSWNVNNLLSYCGLVDAKIRASDKDLPVICWSQIRHCDVTSSIIS